MFHLLWVIPAAPLAGFAVLALAGRRLPRPAAAAVGVGSVGVSAVLSFLMGALFLFHPPPNDYVFVQTLWTWMSVANFAPSVAFRLDLLSLLMILVITGVGFLIHLYSAEYMRGDQAFTRFFAYMNLFVSMMLILVLADNLALLYLGWEGVGLCSYLLIGFWSDNPANGAAARKAFIVTRVGDTAMAIALFLLFTQLGTLDIQALLFRAKDAWPAGSGLAIAAAALLLIGALGKSAQLPLQTWLPDAMAGPTPVSALIHAATMVTAGVYLIARTNVLFTLAPVVQSLVAIIGSATLLVAGLSALVQTDIKRVLAYSTISQIGYMFLALGVGAWQAAMFHFMTHAFFKALLFLGAGAVIISLHHEQNMLKMGGLRRQLPVTFWTFLIGACSLSALPFVTAGYYSKDMILHEVWTSGPAGTFLWIAGAAGAFLTALYTFRMVFIVWFGSEYRLQPGVSSEYKLQPGVSSEYRLQPGVSSEYRLQPGVSSEYRLQPGVPTKLKTEVIRAPGWFIHIPLVLLAILSIAGGFIEIPAMLGQVGHVGLVGQVRPVGREWVFQIVALGFPLLGIGLAYTLYMRPRRLAHAQPQRPILDGIRRWWFVGWGFDWLYGRLFVMPFLRIARANRDDAADLIYQGIAWLNVALHHALRATQSGRVRWYAAGIALGAAIILGIVVVT